MNKGMTSQETQDITWDQDIRLDLGTSPSPLKNVFSVKTMWWTLGSGDAIHDPFCSVLEDGHEPAEQKTDRSWKSFCFQEGSRVEQWI